MDEIGDVTTDGPQDIIITGAFAGTATFGSTSLMSNGGSDIVIAKYDGAGNAWPIIHYLTDHT